MKRRHMLTAMTGSAFIDLSATAAESSNHFLEIRHWLLHNTPEDQPKRVAEYLEKGFGAALERSGAKLVGAFTNFIGADGPNYVTVSEFGSWAAMGGSLNAIRQDEGHNRELQKLSGGQGLPFVRVESSLLRCFDAMPSVVVETDKNSAGSRIFELRTYESQSFATLPRKIDMFNHGEMQIFQRVGMRPVFFGETIVGPRQPSLTYMLSFNDWDARDRLWKEFQSDAEWKKLSGPAEMKDPQIVSNISNVILKPLAFSRLR
ncbi:MAG: NIPSNAP family protein [Bryobacteraceae bacterium]